MVMKSNRQTGKAIACRNWLVSRVSRFWTSTAGQDTVEYTLLLAFVVLISSAMFLGASPYVNNIWGTGSNVLSNASVVAGS